MSPPEIRDYSKEATFRGRRLDFSLGNKPRARRLADASCRLIMMEEKRNLYVGVDYHKNSFTAAYLDILTGVITCA